MAVTADVAVSSNTAAARNGVAAWPLRPRIVRGVNFLLPTSFREPSLRRSRDRSL